MTKGDLRVAFFVGLETHSSLMKLQMWELVCLRKLRVSQHRSD